MAVRPPARTSEKLRRRDVLVGAGAALVATSAAPALAQVPGMPGQPAPALPAPPKAWFMMSQKELDDAYDQSVYAPNLQQITKRYETNSEAVRRRLGQPQRHAYGEGKNEGLDLYPAKRANAPINVFIHGGAWRGGIAKNSAYFAENFVHAGAHLAVIDFDWVQDRNGDLMPIADQVRRAVAWVHKNAARLGADPDRLYVSGHSSGGHLAGVVMTTDWPKAYGVPMDIVKGGFSSAACSTWRRSANRRGAAMSPSPTRWRRR